MTDTSSLPVSSPARSRRGLRLLLLLAVCSILAIVAFVGWRRWKSDRPPEPPSVSLESVVPQIADLVREARAEVVRNPWSPHAWGRLGKVLLVNGFARDSTVCFEQAAKLAPDQPRWPYYLAMYYWKPNPRRARAYLEQSAAICDREEPETLEPRFSLIDLLLEEGELEAAQKEMERVAGISPEHPRLRYVRGVLACRRQQWRQARELLEPLVASPRVRKLALEQLIIACNRLGAERLAERYERRQAALPPDLGWQDRFAEEAAELNVGLRLRQPQGSARDLEQTLATLSARAQEEGKNDFRTHLHLGSVLLQLGRLDDAEKAALRAAELSPDKARTYGLRGWIAYRRGEALRQSNSTRQARERFEEAVDLLGKAVRISDQEAPLLFQFSQALRACGRTKEALPVLQRAVKLSPEVAEIHLALGEVHGELGQKKRALEHFEKAVGCAGPGDTAPARKLAEYRKKWKLE